ncbi:hypothetical protein CYMTET_41036 [Cymbomonas tetramitiformis]|uniref:Right handed beta helix domain-containing protein n=1 Tax=Cymbomonas tetramitiformis TaxID=36881 RepID=A0AAE0C6Z1_9CHLO|nr:hypothetical protein CYMTET_41036 [Cymbomonas tetramitiformis]
MPELSHWRSGKLGGVGKCGRMDCVEEEWRTGRRGQLWGVQHRVEALSPEAWGAESKVLGLIVNWDDGLLEMVARLWLSLWGGGGVTARNNSLFSMHNAVTISNNRAGGEGGGLCFLKGTLADICSSSIQNNSASDGAGIAANMDAHVTCNNTLMQGNEARIYGGGISVKGLSNLSITRSNVINNIAGMDGGALFLYASSEATVSNCTFAMNEGAQGGAIALLHHAKVAIFSHSTITTSRSTSHGGAISIIDLSLAVISNTMFFNNRAEGYGGHVHLKSSNVMMTDCILQISRADLAGGAIHARSSMLNITRADIHKAVSQLGAGLDLQHSTAVLKQVSLSRCLGAVEGGGGLVRANSSLEMIDCQVMSCGGGREMQCHGGGLAVQDAGSLLVSNSKFMGNSAYSGAGVYITSMPAFLDISNVVFEYGNSTIGGGIAMSIPLYDTPFLQDIRFVNNTATLGPCVFWLYEEDANFVEPECKNCSSTSIPIMATSGVRETVFSDGVDLSEVCISIRSGEAIAPPLSFIILDYYNASVTLIEEQDTQVVVYANDPAWVSGTFSENYVTDEGGVFDELVVHGDPGTTIRMVFRMQSSAEVIVNVSLRCGAPLPFLQA